MIFVILTSVGASLAIPHPAPAGPPVAAVQGELDRTDRADPFDRAAPALSASELGQNRGGQTIVSGTQNVRAVAEGNVIAGNYVAGAVSLSDSALSNFSGLGNIAINTGAQVNLLSVMNLTVNITP